MEKRKVLLEDGRYLIYYTFDDETEPSVTEPTEPEHDVPREGERHE